VAYAAVSTELPVLSSKTVRASEHCVVHPKGVHTNEDCVEQKDARKQNLRIEQLITILKALQLKYADSRRKSKADKQSRRKTTWKSKSDKESTTPVASSKPARFSKASELPDKSKDTTSPTPASKSSPSKRVSDDASIDESKGSSATSKKKRRTKESAALVEEVVNVTSHIDGGGDPPEDSTEEKTPDWDNMDDTALPYTQRRRRYSEDDDVVFHGDDTDDNGYYPSQEISPSDHAFMMTLSSLSNLTESRVTSTTAVAEELIDTEPVKTVVLPSPIKVTTEYESGDDDLVQQVRADRTARELAAVNAARRGEVLYRGYPQVSMGTNNELVIESMNLAQWADIYCHYAIHEGFEVKETRKAMLTFNILLNMTENLQESQGQPLTSRNDFPKVDYADTAYVAYLDAKEEAINEAAIANKRRREVSNTYFHSPNFLTTLSSYDYIVHDMPIVEPTTQKVEVPVSSVDTSSHSSEGSVEFESH